ncbi:MAG: tetratricopeptide repeat protein [Candidatus Sumerlaeota bacterium]|nr:tetratricopeptide repeat protein [Candidatus Sumerlaeota bacterium]
MAYALGVFAMWGLFLLLNYQRHGSALPAYLHPEWYRYEGSIFAAVDKGPKPYYSVASRLYHVTLGHYGVLLMTPLLAFAVWGALARWRRRKDFEPLMVVGCAAALLLGVALNPSAQGHDLGGGSYGLRWFTALYAPLFLYLPAAAAMFWGFGVRGSGFGEGCSEFRVPSSESVTEPPASIVNRQSSIINHFRQALFILSAVFSVAVAFIGVWISPWPHNAISPYPFLDNLCAAALNNTAPPHPIVESIIRNTSVDLGLSYHDLGTIYLRRSFYEQAVAAFERARSYAPDRIETPFLMAQALERCGRLEPAARILQELLRAQPEHAGALNLLGIILIRGQQPRQALEIYDRLLAKNPNHISALNNSAMILSADGQTTAALERYDRSLSVSPGNFEALYNKALLMEKLGRRAEAANLARQALERRPDHKGCQALANRTQP